MASSSGSTVDQSEYPSRGQCGRGWCRKGNWSGMNIAAMVLGFVFFWPVGLAILFWIISGRNVQELPQALRNQWSKMSANWHGDRRANLGALSDNVVFNEFQQTQYDRIREIKEEIKERSRRFAEYRAAARRRADEAEFAQFMSDTPVTDNN